MKALHIALAVALGLALPAAAIAQPVKRSAPVSGRIVAKRAGETIRFVTTSADRTVAVRQDLKAGDILRTKANGNLAIVFADRTQIRLARNSVLRVKAVKRGSPSSVQLEKGRVWGRKPRGSGASLSVETPAATAGIRGTEWAISADENGTTLQVFEGEIDFANEQGRLVVTAGQAARAIPGQAPTRIALVDPEGREQMLYFLALEDGLDLFAGEDVPGLPEARMGDWQAARSAFAGVADEGRAGAIARFGEFIAAIRLGEEREVPKVREASAASFVARAFVLSFVGDLDQAIATADAGIALYPAEAGLYEVKARAALLQGDEATAREAVGAALARNPEDPAALALRAELDFRYAGDPYSATRDALRAVDLQPDRIGSWDMLAQVRLERGGNREALAAVDAALQRDPDNAALHARRAEILLVQKRMGAAKRALDRALELDPSLSVVRSSLADYYLLTGKVEQALAEGLAASADNPAYSRALLGLAEVNYRLGEVQPALQQLDAADRLDPDSPLTPLARTAIALHRYEAGQAIVSAAEALDRFEARGGVYSNLSENRESGSLVSQAFRFLNLEAWGRFYADQVFDAFTPSSYFDRALLQTPGPFVQRDADGNFDPGSSEDLSQLSSFLQGIALDPLSVAESKRRLLFDNGQFFEAELGGSFLEEKIRNRQTVRGSIDAITMGPFPIGFALDADHVEYDDQAVRPDVSPFTRNDGGRSTDVRAFLGLEPGANDQFTVAATYRTERSRALSISALASDPDEVSELVRQENRTIFGLWGHEFGYRSRSTIAAGKGRIATDTAQFDFANRTGLLDIDRLEFSYVSANMAHSFGPLDVRGGTEFADITSEIGLVSFDPELVEDGPFDLFAANRTKFRELRFYLDLHYRAAQWLELQVQGEKLDIKIKNLPVVDPDIDTYSQNEFNYRLGAAVQPLPGHWLRLARVRENQPLLPFTLRPLKVIGLRGVVTPLPILASTRQTIMRWDAEWSRRFFISVEFVDQRDEFVDYTLPDLTISASGGPVRIRRLGIEANWWLARNIGLRASYARVDSAIRGTFQTGANAVNPGLTGFGCATSDSFLSNTCEFRQGDRLPFVPKHTVRSSLTWVLPAPIRLRAILTGSWYGGQSDDLNRPVPDYAIADARLEWEPLERRFVFSLAALNLFDKKYDSATQVAAPRLTLIGSASVRF